jgi:hypothetical protein
MSIFAHVEAAPSRPAKDAPLAVTLRRRSPSRPLRPDTVQGDFARKDDGPIKRTSMRACARVALVLMAVSASFGLRRRDCAPSGPKHRQPVLFLAKIGHRITSLTTLASGPRTTATYAERRTANEAANARVRQKLAGEAEVGASGNRPRLLALISKNQRKWWRSRNRFF